MLFRFFVFIVCFSLSFSAMAMDLNKQRKDYLRALAELQRGDEPHFQQISDKLRDYPLYPYLRYAYLVKNIHTVPTTDIESFLAQYNDTPLAQKLWVVWLESLAEDKQWQEFLKLYHPTENVTLQCLARQGLWYSGFVQPALNGVSDLWLDPKRPPPACQMIINQWQDKGGLTLTLLWERIYIAMTSNNIDLIRELIPMIPANQRWVIELWAAVFLNPHLLNEQHLLDHTEPVTRFILKVGMQKLVYENAEQALLLWKNLQTQYTFSTYEKQEVARIIGVELAAQGDPEAINWLAAAGNDNTDESAELWRVRIALLNQNWPGVLAAIAQLPTDQQRLEAWQYWQARALAEMGQTVNASIIYEDLARQQDYYGQLAAMQLGMKISKKFRTHIVEEQQLQNIADLPGMQRAHELFVLNFKYAAREEWQYQLNKLPRYQYLNAAQLATRWGWYECAIATNQLLGQKGDIALRYPLAFNGDVNGASRQFNINPAWIFAEIRQESLFQTQAHSGAGAMGLMQLLPSTATLLADKLHLNFLGAEILFDPNDNIEIGSDYLNTLLNEFHGNMLVATASYDAGPARIARWIGKQKDIPADIWVETIPWPETRDYVKNIMASTSLYEEQLGMPVSFEKRMKENI